MSTNAPALVPATPATPAALPRIDDAGFAALLAEPGVTLIDFTAAWCGPCKQLAPILRDLAGHYRGRVRVVTIDVEDSPIATQALRVVSMPTMVLVRGGREVGRLIGLRPARYVAGALDRALAGEVAIAGP